MENIQILVFGIIVLLIILLLVLLFKNNRLAGENQELRELLARRHRNSLNHDTIVVRKVIKNIPISDKVMQSIEAGESKINISKKLKIPMSKIELIVKFHAIKNRS